MKELKKKKKWSIRYAPTAENASAVKSLADALGVLPTTAKLLFTRGLRTAEEATVFLKQAETSLHDPFMLKDIERAVARILEALEKGERIAIYGDYDVDGVTSVSLLYTYLSRLGADIGYYIPCRSREGYGLSTSAIDILKERGVELIITVDTGITAMEEVAYATALGIDTVVTDHHECRPELPEACALVNPHRADDAYPFKDLAGVGVVFKLICALEMTRCRMDGRSEIDGVRQICREYADLVAIGTIADVMPIVDENRLIVALGLKLLEETKRPGLRALIDAASGNRTGDQKFPPKKRKINSGFIGFVLAPRINAAGRVSSASIAVELLLATDNERAAELAEELCNLNTTRQVEENRIAVEVYQKIEQMPTELCDRIIVIEGDTWQQGIIGIVSSRITERYGLPSILISFDGSTRGFASDDDLGKGSGRSIKGLNLVEALADSEEHLARFGGHELAAGLTIRRGNIDAFRKQINQYAHKHLTEDMLCISIDADCEVQMKDLTLALAQEIDKLEPFGTSNPVPNFVLRDASLLRIIPMGNGKHTKLILEKDGISMVAVWFGTEHTSIPFEIGDRLDVMFQLNINEFQNVTSLQMIVQDIQLSVVYEESFKDAWERYEEIRAGAPITADEDVIPTRQDMACVYTLLRREHQIGHTYFPIRRILSLVAQQGTPLGYYKLKTVIRIMQELNICDITEPMRDCFVFDFYFNPTKTSIEKSSILKKLKLQLCRGEETR
ncbi:MAG: single-stranded-DNA-specific exonuclease RecJ [Ruminococcaceae bacterium]|nr:single-stranded-DNA-specific exonuclease RecJ [Oscillospiraceae bacterium]